MSVVKDPRIKLFGKTIELPEICHAAVVESFRSRESKDGFFIVNREGPESDKDERFHEMKMQGQLKDEHISLRDLTVECDASSRTEDKAEICISSGKSLKKPETILPCPRCDSKDTKFCYFNNYNTNQPRHFCKSCQRYWTAGGTMRNVPFGAGRRKNKNSALQFHHIGLQSMGVDHLDGFHSDPLCEASFNIGDDKLKSISCNRNRSEDCGPSLESSIASSKDEEQINSNPQIPCFSGSLWPYQWHAVQWGSAPSPSTFTYSGFPQPMYSATPAFIGSWNFPWIIPSDPKTCNTGPLSPSLGKHAREQNNHKTTILRNGKLESNFQETEQSGPKTPKIEGAKNSVKGVIHINEEQVKSIGGLGNLFEGFQKQSKDKRGTPSDIEKSSVLQANPAALSRSLTFHENS